MLRAVKFKSQSNLIFLALTCARMGKLEEALECYTIATLIDPSDEKAMYNRRIILGRLRKDEEELEW